MALQPSLNTFVVEGSREATHSLDVFLDFICPYSAKMVKAIDTILKPLLGSNGKYEGKVKLVFRHQVQPWHGSSIYPHEASLAVARVAPEKSWEYIVELFKNQNDFYDKPTANLTPLQIRQKLIDIAEPIIGKDKAHAALDLLAYKTTPNGGNAVTEQLKYTIKFSRQNHVHVSPTVLWDGLEASEVSSGWGEKEWNDFFAAKVVG